MKSQSYLPNYFSFKDIFVTQEKVECKINTKLLQMGFLDPGSLSDDLAAGKVVNLPLWYLQELKVDNPCFSVEVPSIYRSVHKAVCEAETTHIDLGKLHPYFYEFGRYLTRYDRSNTVGKIVFETMRQRVRHLMDISKNTNDDKNPVHRLDSVESNLYKIGMRTNACYMNWMQLKTNQICMSEMVHQHSKKRKRANIVDDDCSQGPSKRSST